MAFKLALNLSVLKKVSSYSVVLASFFLTFLYIVELCIGIRTVVYVFHLWNHTSVSPSTADDVHWMIVVGALLLSVITSCTINAISAFWDSDNTFGVRSALFYAIHILTGGIIWRYIRLLRCESSETKKEEAMFIASLKFFFTQFFTIPLLILHIFLLCHLNELIYDFIITFGIAISLVLTCVIFDNYEQYGEYPYETMTLVPLLFKALPPKEDESVDKKLSKEAEATKKEEPAELLWKNTAWKSVVGFQTLLFTSGRLLALGVLLKLAGIYGLTIILLQILLSVLYLKFQAAYLVPESLSKFKQLMRLCFLSYILVFEWQLHRDTSTGYTMQRVAKHGIFYYSITTIESMFYLIFWMMTTNEIFSKDLGMILRHQYPLVITVIGCSCLLASYVIHVFLVLSKVESCSSILASPRELYPRIRVVLTNSLESFGRKNSTDPRSIPAINISSFTDTIKENNGTCNSQEVDNSEQTLKDEQHGSYRDLREPIGEDYAIHIQTIPKEDSKIRSMPITKSEELDIKQNDRHYKNEADLKPHPTDDTKVMQRLTKRCIPSPKFLKHSKSTGDISIGKIKDCKEFNFLKTFKRNGKNQPEKQSVTQSDANLEKNVKRSNITNKITAVSTSLSSQFNKLTTIKGIKSLTKKNADVPKQNSLDIQVTIPTIMNTYKDEMAVNEDETKSETYRPVVPPRTRRGGKSDNSENNIINSEEKPTKIPFISKYHSIEENSKKRTLSTSSSDGKMTAAFHSDEKREYSKEDYNSCNCSVEDHEIYNNNEKYAVEKNANENIEHSYRNQISGRIPKVHSAIPLGDNTVDDDEHSYTEDDLYSPDFEVNDEYEEDDVIFDSSLKLDDSTSFSRDIEYKLSSHDDSLMQESTQSLDNLEHPSDTEHYV